MIKTVDFLCGRPLWTGGVRTENLFISRSQVVRILKGKQQVGVTLNFDKLGSIDFTKFSKLALSSA